MFKMPWTNSTTPNVMLEITNVCNITCPACFSPHQNKVKTLEEIEQDLNAAARLRKLHTVTLSGGEPTLHPKLCDIVRMVKARGYLCFLLTNGLLLDEAYLEKLKAAGLDSVLFHVDTGQKRPDLPKVSSFADVKQRLEELTGIAKARGIDVSFSLTLYSDDKEQFDYMLDYFMSLKEVTFLFIARATDAFTCHSVRKVPVKGDASKAPPPDPMTLGEVKTYFRSKYGLEPYAYIPAVDSQGNEASQPIWISYFIPLVYKKGAAPKIYNIKATLADRLIQYVPFLLKGHFIHKTNQHKSLTLFRLFLNASVSLKLLSLLRFVGETLEPGAVLRHKMVVYDDGPRLNSRGDQVMCEYCPTAIVRDGDLVSCCNAKKAVRKGGRP